MSAKVEGQIKHVKLDNETEETLTVTDNNKRHSASDLNSSIVQEFNQRDQKLATVVRRLSSGAIIEEHILNAFSHELANYHVASTAALAAHFSTSLVNGLHQSQVSSLLKTNGPNELPKSNELPLIVKLLYCFIGGFSPLLWIAFAFVFITYTPFGTAPSNIYNLALAIALLIVIFLSAIFTFYQEVLSTIVSSAFKTLVPQNCLVIRDGKTQSISPIDLVVGDLIVLETGMRVPSDFRVISASDLKIDKSMLTGENIPVKLFPNPLDSSVPLLQANNVGFMGCNVVEGEGMGVVIATGKKNQLYKIAEQVGRVSSSLTSLQVEINRFVLFIAAIAIITSVTCVLYWKFYLNVEHNGFMTLDSMICNAISVLVAFIPEGLPLALQTGLTIITNRLCVTHSVLVKQLSIIETVGSMTMLASDKTGTLTQNKMSVATILQSNKLVDVKDVKSLDLLILNSLKIAAVMCNQCKLQEDEHVPGHRVAVGSNGIDRALLNWIESLGGVDEVKDKTALKLLVPFSSATKITSAVVCRDGAFIVIVKGAPEYVLDRSSHYFDDISGSIQPLSKEIIDKFLQNISVVASSGKRVIAVAELQLPKESYADDYHFIADPTPNFPTSGYTFISCVAVSDPPRPGVREAIETMRRAGIKVAMVTGDASNTAAAIARQVGIISDESNDVDTLREFNEAEKLDLKTAIPLDIESRKAEIQADSSRSSTKKSSTFSRILRFLTRPRVEEAVVADSWGPMKKSSAIIVDGRDLDAASPVAWNFIFSHSEMVFARTTPDQKLAIVKESQERGFRVGVTGDGVNDSPALKQANVGIAMGKSGSDVAKDAANIILLNDDFTAITKAVLEGRLIFANLRKVIGYQIAAGCWSELIPVIATFFFGMPQPLSSFLMIIISCTTDVCAGIALMNEPPETSILEEPPRDLKKSRLVTWRLICYAYLWYGNLQSVGSFINYFDYMAGRGNDRALPDPLPTDDSTGPYQYPAGYRPAQLIFAWNFEGGSATSPLYLDETAAANVASSVFFVTLIVCQMGHVMSIRRKTPYFSDAILGEGDGGVWNRLWKKILSIRPIYRILLAWSAAVVIANIFNEIPAVQSACGTGSVPARNWGIAIGWSFLVFLLDQCRKWIVILYPKSIVAKLSWEVND